MDPLVHSPTRLATLDILRGAAVMGILAMNIVSFSMPEPAYSNPIAYGGSSGIDLFVWGFNFIFVDGRMRGLFSLLFGASMMLIIERSCAKEESPFSVHYRRMAWLLMFGVLHFFFIWQGDILAHYALVGMVAYLFRHQRADTLIVWAVGLIILETAIMTRVGTGFIEAGRAAAAPGASAEAISRWQDMQSTAGPLPPAELAADLALHKGAYLPIVADRLREWDSLFTTLLFIGPETLAFMLLGMAGLRSGFLAGRWERGRYRRWALIGYLVSAPVFAGFAFAIIASGFNPALVVMLGLAATTPFRIVMVLAVAALIILLTQGGGKIVSRIAAAGRAAFTNYIGTSLVMTFLFYGYGLGLYGDMRRGEVYLVVLAMWALILLWSKPWLDRFRYGPFEWLWRTLARGALQPMRKIAPAGSV